MKFTVDAWVRLRTSYRLQENNIWRQLEEKPYNPLEEGDRLFQKLGETHPFLSYQGELELGSKVYQVNPEIHRYGDTSIASVRPIVHRQVKPRRFSREELIDLIAGGDDNRFNTLVLDLEGYFKLMDPREAQSKISPVAVRHETFCAGNDYVGLEASRDERLVEETFLSSLEGWVIHLTLGRLNIYQDYLERRKNESELWREVDELTKELAKKS